MALGDGVTWNETLPTDDTNISDGDDHIKDLRVGVRLRMDNEHVWNSSQTGTSSAGQHRFITFAAQTAAPTVTGTKVGAVYFTTTNDGFFVNSAGTGFRLFENTYGFSFDSAPKMAGFLLTANASCANKELVGMCLETRTDDNGCTQSGRVWLRTDI